MEEKKITFSSKSVSNSNSNSQTTTFLGNGGEKLTVIDNGKRISAQVDGKEVGYLTYEVDVVDDVKTLRFGYILVTKAYQSKKLSSLMLALFALNALNLGIMVVVVGHPDPGLKGYWTAMGFDYLGAQKKQWLYLKSNYKEEDLPSVTDVVVTEASASTLTLLSWAQKSYRAYWTPT
ncbi:MAG TPA: hypothetical protein VF017_23445 [Thermoanaerobaculia bacterium]|nr:hypothetical protein [Thermoanaerobaculia bacterium]